MTHPVQNTESIGEFVDYLMQEWSQIVHLFELVDNLEDYLNTESLNISDMLDIKSYTFRDLVLEYGPKRQSTMRVQWNSPQSKFKLIFAGVKVSSINITFLMLVEHCTTSFLFATAGGGWRQSTQFNKRSVRAPLKRQ